MAKLYAYKNGSKSAKALCESLGIKRLKHEGPLVRTNVLINWGASNITRNVECEVLLNDPDAVKIASNKLKTFRAIEEANLGGVTIPEFTTSSLVAKMWLDKGHAVVARHKLSGHSGEGIEIIDPRNEDIRTDEFFLAPLFTKYVKKDEEYRVHVMNGKAFFIQRKAKRKDIPREEVNYQIRNHANGFIFAHKDLGDLPEGLEQSAIMAVKALGLHFGGVDVIYSRKTNLCTVLEVNTACGLEGTTLEKYAEQFELYWKDA